MKEFEDIKRRFKCPLCNLKTVVHLPKKRRYTEVYIYQKYYCFNCEKGFDNVRPLALVDGIFLNRNNDLKIRSKKYIEELCSREEGVWLSDTVKRNAIAILNEYDDGFGKRSVAGACVYIASIICDKKRTQREICDATNITSSTLRKQYKTIAKKVKVDEKVAKGIYPVV